MARKASAGVFDRINLRIRLDLKAAIESAIASGDISSRTFADYLSALAEADLKSRGLLPEAKKPAAKRKAKAEARKVRKAK